MTLSRFDQLVQQRNALKAWASLGDTVAKYDGKRHVLRVDANLSMVAYCGQEYAGAQNYHKAPEFFVAALSAMLSNHAESTMRSAVAVEIERLDAEIEEMRDAVMRELNAASTKDQAP